jgi:putative transposase
MLKTFKYRIYPNKEQEALFIKTFGCIRFVWNKMLEEKLNALNNKQKIPRITPTKYKKDYSFLKEVDSLALANAQLSIEKAFRNFFKNPKYFKLPKFKSKKNKQSYTTNSANNNIKVDFEKKLIYLPKIKQGIKAKFHRRFNGKIKSVNIKLTNTNKFYASILIKTDEVKNKIKDPNSKSCGIDLGLKNFAIITNDNETYKIEHPKYLIKSEKKLKRLQRKLSKKQKGSKNRSKMKIRLGVQYEHVINARNDFLHKLSKVIIDENQVIVVEDLNVNGMIKNHKLSRSISDSGWYVFVKCLEYKTEWYGRNLVKVDRFFPSSRMCNKCGYINETLRLSDRYWKCPSCNTKHDRDINASINLYKIGLERPEFKPVEHALVDDRISYEMPKKPSCVKTGSSTFYKVG